MTVRSAALQATSSDAPMKRVVVPMSNRPEGIQTITLGFQPLGIASRIIPRGEEIAIASYYEPAICLAMLRVDDGALDFSVEWIRGVNDVEGKSIRLFPGLPAEQDVNRAGAVCFDTDGNLWVARNADHRFFIFKRPAMPGGRWTLDRKVELPFIGQMIHSAAIEGDHLHTIESRVDLTGWHRAIYRTDGCSITKLVDNTQNVEPWTYGIGLTPDSTDMLFVKDPRCSKGVGIYRERERMLGEISGNGICVLQNGGALVTQYGQTHSSPFGEPGTLMYLQPSLLQL